MSTTILRRTRSTAPAVSTSSHRDALPVRSGSGGRRGSPRARRRLRRSRCGHRLHAAQEVPHCALVAMSVRGHSAAAGGEYAPLACQATGSCRRSSDAEAQPGDDASLGAARAAAFHRCGRDGARGAHSARPLSGDDERPRALDPHGRCNVLGARPPPGRPRLRRRVRRALWSVRCRQREVSSRRRPASDCSSAHATDGLSCTKLLKFQDVMPRQRSSVSAVTVAERWLPSSSAISPK